MANFSFIFDLTEHGISVKNGAYDPAYYVETDNTYAWSDPDTTMYRVVDVDGEVIAGPTTIDKIAGAFEDATGLDRTYLSSWTDKAQRSLKQAGLM